MLRSRYTRKIWIRRTLGHTAVPPQPWTRNTARKKAGHVLLSLLQSASTSQPDVSVLQKTKVIVALDAAQTKTLDGTNYKQFRQEKQDKRQCSCSSERSTAVSS